MTLHSLLSQITLGENSTLPLKAVCRYSRRGGQTPTGTDGQEPFCLAVLEAVYV